MRSRDAYEAELMDEAVLGFEDGDPFMIRTVLQGIRQPWTLRAGPGPIPERMARRLASNPGRGVFLDGATQRQAFEWASAIALALPGGTVVHDPRNAHYFGSLPHFHVEIPAARDSSLRVRMAHIFYGRAPAGEFFDE